MFHTAIDSVDSPATALHSVRPGLEPCPPPERWKPLSRIPTSQAAAGRAKADSAAYQALDQNAHFHYNDPNAKLGQQAMERIIGN
ncbi:MAG: hypothetical protein CTR55_12395 [Pseudomonas sp.]|nr:MAG: hypothetical protein CTR55_12395 [Pseudomonas sp.]